MHDHVYYLMEAVTEARLARDNGNAPFGAILTDGDGNIILRRQNVENTEQDCAGHAETVLARAAGKLLEKNFSGAAPCIPLPSPAPCAPEPFTGPTSGASYTTLRRKNLALRRLVWNWLSEQSSDRSAN
jgi:hypothetical protein